MPRKTRTSTKDGVEQPVHEAQVEHYEMSLGDGGVEPPNPNKTRELTPQQRELCFYYLESGNKTDAYRRAYNPDPEARHTARRANEVFKHPAVIAFLEEIYDRALARNDINIDVITANLIEDRKLAFTCEDPKAAVAADLGLAKLHGLLVDRKKIESTTSLEVLIREAQARAGRGLPNPAGRIIDGESETVSSN